MNALRLISIAVLFLTGACLEEATWASLPSRGGEGTVATIANFAAEGELAKWTLGNSGPKSKVQLVAGPAESTAVQVACVYETGLGYYQADGTPYMSYRRAFDGHAAAEAGSTRMSFWHKGDGVKIVFNEIERGDAYCGSIEASQEWRRVFVCFADLAQGWSGGGTGKGSFDLARMESFHLAVSPSPGKPRGFAVSDFRLERAVDDLDPLAFIGSKAAARLDLYPRTLNLPVNRTQPLLVVVSNEERCGLSGVKVELSLEGEGSLSQYTDRAGKQLAKSLCLVTNDEGKAQARYHPTKTVGQKCVITARIADKSSIPAACARFTTAPEFHKVTLGPDGFFVRPDGDRIIPLGGLFLPWWRKVVDGKVGSGVGFEETLIVADEVEQRGWFAYLKDNGVNCMRGWWFTSKRGVKLGPGGAEIPGTLDLDGKIHEPVVAALERTMAIGGEYGVAFTLTIANCARPFIAPRGKAKKPKRLLMHEANDFLREFVPRLMFNPNVWAYELTNEQALGTFEWSEHFIQTIKELDEVTPVMVSHSGGGLKRADPLAWMRNTGLDVYQPHLYPNETKISPEIDAGLVQEIHYNGMRGSKPWLLGEAGWWHIDAAVIVCHNRDNLWFALLNRACGAFLWGPTYVTPFKIPSKIAPLVDWKALSDARAMVGVAVPRDISKPTFFRSAEGKQALKVMAEYARWGMENGVTVDFVLDAAGYEVRRSALEPFDPPRVRAPFTIGKGYQFKYRMSADGKLVVGYFRNVAKISKLTVDTWFNASRPWAYFRVREPLTAEIKWKLPAEKYSLTVWDLDTGKKTDIPNATQTGTWQQQQTDHDFVLMWQARG